jgi:hypothetical protein
LDVEIRQSGGHERGAALVLHVGCHHLGLEQACLRPSEVGQDQHAVVQL